MWSLPNTQATRTAPPVSHHLFGLLQPPWQNDQRQYLQPAPGGLAAAHTVLPSQQVFRSPGLCCIVWQPLGLIKGFPTIQIKENQQSIHHNGDGHRHHLEKKMTEESTKTADWKFKQWIQKIQHPARCFQQYQRIFCWWYENHSVPPDRWASRRTEPTPIFHSWSALAHIAWNLPGSHRRLASWIHSQSVPGQTTPIQQEFLDVYWCATTISSLSARIY